MPNREDHHREARERYDLRLYVLKQSLQRGDFDQTEFDVRKELLDESIRPPKRENFFRSLKNSLGISETHSKEVSQAETIRIDLPPGYRLGRVFMFLLPPADYNRILLQTISDMRQEYYEALSQDRKFKARYILLRDNFRILLAVVRYYLWWLE